MAADLKIRSAKGKGRDILYLLDHATSFILAEFIPNKKPETIAKVLNNMWYSRSFPFIKTLLSDNGNEFTGSPMIEVLEMLNVKHEVTAGFTPQQNGGVERIHAIVDLNMEMLMDGSTIGEEEALAMAVNAYNQMELKSGVSPSFLVYNVATTFPSIQNIAPTSLENVVEDLPRSLGDLIKGREEAMANHLQLKMSDKLRRAILAKTRPSREQKELGELVYFKRANDDRWRGPGVVSDSVRGQVSVKMGRYFYPCRHEDLLRLNDMEQRAYKEQNRNLSHDNETGHTVAVHNSIEEDNNIILETEFSTLQSNQPEVVPYLSQSSREQESTETTNCNLSLPDATHRNLSLPDTNHRKLSLSDDETEIIVN